MLTQNHGLRCLSVTVDNGFLSDMALDNIRRVTDALNVDHLLIKPAFKFMRNLYTESMKGGVHPPAAALRASDVCNSCISLINNQMIKIALQNEVYLIAGGYLGGQVPKNSVVLTIDPSSNTEAKKNQLDRYLNHFGENALRYFSIPERSTPPITVINPLLSVQYSEDQIVDEIGTLGWRKPADTGTHSSNCLLNDFGIFAHNQKYGFHPYAFDLADLVRKGYMDRTTAIAKLEAIPDKDALGQVFDKLGLSKD
jgi:hypothetical protein